MRGSKRQLLRGVFAGALCLAGASARADGPTVGGFVDFGYNYNFNKQTANVLRVFDANANSFTLQDGKVAVSGTTKDNVSYRVDVIYGFDAAQIHSAGFVTGGGNAQVDLEQAFVSYPCPWTGGTWTVGKFVTLHGAEVIEAKDDFNISRGLLFNYAIPFTHTGIKYEKVFGPLDVIAGLVNGWDNLQDNNKGKSVHAMATYTVNPKIKASLGGTYGPEQKSPDAVTGASTEKNGRGLVDALVTFTPTDKLTLIANYDWGVEEGLNPTNSGFTPTDTNRTANWSGIALHANYAFTDKNSVAVRFENFADDGSRTATAPSTDVNGNALQPIVLDSLTLTFQHKLSSSVITRLEYRNDTSNKDVYTDSHGVAAKTKTQSTVGGQVIFTF
jgi:hypothetical protein